MGVELGVLAAHYEQVGKVNGDDGGDLGGHAHNLLPWATTDQVLRHEKGSTRLNLKMIKMCSLVVDPPPGAAS